jgi:hypothetical protein
MAAYPYSRLQLSGLVQCPSGIVQEAHDCCWMTSLFQSAMISDRKAAFSSLCRQRSLPADQGPKRREGTGIGQGVIRPNCHQLQSSPQASLVVKACALLFTSVQRTVFSIKRNLRNALPHSKSPGSATCCHHVPARLVHQSPPQRTLAKDPDRD